MQNTYPDNFETPAFPAGKSIAVARVAAIATGVVFALIMVACVTLVWASRSRRVHTFLIEIENPARWQLVGHEHDNRTISALRAMQESVVVSYVKNRFSISANPIENDIMWSECGRDIDCAKPDERSMNARPCPIYCASAATVFAQFASDIVPDYRARADAGERWSVNTDTLRVAPMDRISDERGGTWRVLFTIVSNQSAPIKMIAYVKIARISGAYPRTMGFYVADFNAYRLDA